VDDNKSYMSYKSYHLQWYMTHRSPFTVTLKSSPIKFKFSIKSAHMKNCTELVTTGGGMTNNNIYTEN